MKSASDAWNLGAEGHLEKSSDTQGKDGSSSQSPQRGEAGGVNTLISPKHSQGYPARASPIGQIQPEPEGKDWSVHISQDGERREKQGGREWTEVNDGTAAREFYSK